MADRTTEGFTNQAVGKAKEFWGKLTGSKHDEISGDAQQVKGKAERAIDNASDRRAEHGQDEPKS